MTTKYVILMHGNTQLQTAARMKAIQVGDSTTYLTVHLHLVLNDYHIYSACWRSSWWPCIWNLWGFIHKDGHPVAWQGMPKLVSWNKSLIFLASMGESNAPIRFVLSMFDYLLPVSQRLILIGCVNSSFSSSFPLLDDEHNSLMMSRIFLDWNNYSVDRCLTPYFVCSSGDCAWHFERLSMLHYSS